MRKISSTRAKYITTAPRAKPHPLPILPILPSMMPIVVTVRVSMRSHCVASRCPD